MWKQQILEKSLSNEEISDRMFKMLQERQSQDAEFRAKYSKTSTIPQWQYQAIEKPLSNEEISDRMFKMLQERQSQDAEFRARITSATTRASIPNMFQVPSWGTDERPISFEKPKNKPS